MDHRPVERKVAAHHAAEAHEEEIHLPSPTLAPAIIGLAVTLLAFGVLFGIVFIVLGAAIFVAGLATWLINDAREFVRTGEQGHGQGGH